MLIPASYYDAVVPVAYEIPPQGENWQTRATGFLYSAQRSIGDQAFERLFFVTNKHNVRDEVPQPNGPPQINNVPVIYLGFDPEDPAAGPGGFFEIALLEQGLSQA